MEQQYFDTKEYLDHVRLIDLTKALEPEQYEDIDVKLVRAEVPKKAFLPIVLVRYSRNNRIPPYGIRLDLDKRSFIDFPFLNEIHLHNFFSRIAQQVAEYIYREWLKMDRSQIGNS